MSSLTHLSLFSGIGGLDLAAEWAGFHTNRKETKMTIWSVNEPLTLNELREMDGEPVFLVPLNIGHPSDGLWALVDLEHELCWTAKGGMAVFENYGKTWIAYRHKPEGVAE